MLVYDLNQFLIYLSRTKSFPAKFEIGCNVENAAYSLATCAERTAIVKAVSEGQKEFDTIVVCALNHSNYISPCGGCRQIMSEVSVLETLQEIWFD